MGTTSQKLTYLNGTKQELKQKINNLGGSIDDNTTFRNYANQLQNVYNNLPKTEYQEGTEVNLGKTIKGKLDYDNGVVGIGQSEQVGEPTPSTPIEIKSVTGNQDVVVSGKNKFNIGTSLDEWFQTNNNGTKIGSYTINTTTATILNNTLTIDTYNNAGYNWISKWLELEKNTDYIISGTNTQSLRIVGFDSDALTTQGTQIINKNSNSSEYTKSFNSGDYKYYCLSFYPDTIGRYFSNIIIAEGTDDTYEPYITPKTYQLSLGDIQLNAIGNYKDELIYDVDEDRVYKNENIGKLVLNGSENYAESSYQPTSNLKFYLLQNVPDAKYLDGPSYVVGSALNNYLKDFNQNEYTSGTKEGFLVAQNGMNFCISNMTLQEFKAKLQQNNMEICYITNATKEIPITDTTLKTQVKALYNAQSINGTTIITSNGDLPLVIKVRGLKGE